MSVAREIIPRSPLRGTFRVPGSKSITNRALVCAALAEGSSTIEGPSDSSDSALLANGLDQMGIFVLRKGDKWHVEGKGGEVGSPKFPVPVGNAGTTLRFFLALAALAKGPLVFEGAPRMAERPNEEIFEALRGMGIDCRQVPGLPRYEVGGGGLKGGEIRIRQKQSSQFLSALLLVAPYARSRCEILVDGPRISAPYVEMTLLVMNAFGIVPARDDRRSRYSFAGGERYHPAHFAVEPDASGASYGMAAAAIAGGEVFIPGLRRDSCQGDAAFADLLAAMGCRVEETEDGIVVRRGGELHGIDCDMNGMPDVVPTLCVTALFADTPTRIRNVGHLRFKESDRLEVLGKELRKLGAPVVVEGDGLQIHPVPLTGALLSPHDDHRMAMAFALVGLRVPGVRVEDPECVGKSFPRFWDEFERL
jgi:3-phosphoshikimate 1-carboxyvinyltransferase